MKILKSKILNEGAITEDKLALFLTKEIDVKFLHKVAQEFKDRFENEEFTKILSLDRESSAFSTILSEYFNFIPVLIYDGNLEAINEDDKVLVATNFLSEDSEIYNLLSKLKNNIVALAVIIEKIKKEEQMSLDIRKEILSKVYIKNNKISLSNKKRKQKMMVLTASTGNGHNQAAKNLKIEIEKNGDECKIVNFFKKEDDNNLKQVFFEKGYELFIQKMPHLYSILYKLGDQKLIKDLFSNLLILPRLELKKIIKNEKPDIIISTHPFAVPLIVNSLKEIEDSIPFIQIITDFKPHEMYVDQRIDAYITGSNYTKEMLIKKGIDKDKIYVYGIPIKKSFLKNSSNNNSDFNILVMGGSMGMNGIEQSAEVLLDSDLDIKVTVVCANNEKMQESLRNRFLHHINNGKLKVLGFVDNIDELMENSKLIVTKPGGLTSTEAISKNLPMIIPFCIPGQEQENTDFLVNNNMAMEINDFNNLPKIIKLLMENRELYEEMVNSMKQLAQNYSIDKIIYLANVLVGDK